MTEYVILVDNTDREIGLEEKVKCHMPDGKLHRAFTALLFDESGRLVLTRRSADKMLWPNDWDGTFASHPRQGETFVSSSQRRMPEEMGIECKMDYLFKFEYHVAYKNVGSENEICGTLIGTVQGNTEFDIVKDEISQTKWISAQQMISELDGNAGAYCPWMLIALYYLDASEPQMLAKYKNTLEPWIKPDVKEKIRQSITLPKSQWRLVE